MGEAGHPANGPDPFRILIVCTGNICRSPAAEILLRAQLAARPGAGRVEVASAGTRAVVGSGVHPLTASVLRDRGLDPTGHLARLLTPGDVAAADLVLTAERSHRSAVAALDPDAVRRTFTLQEFARTAAAVTAATGAVGFPAAADAWAVVEVVRAGRGRWPADRPGDDDIADPITGRGRAHRRVIDEIARATACCGAALVLGPGAPAGSVPPI